jgi:predicted RNA methylase
MPNLFTGFGASLYAFATGRISLFRDINAVVANEILDRVASGTVLDVGTGPGHLPTGVTIKNP